MNSHGSSPGGGPETHAISTSKHQTKRLIGLDAARGLALIGLMAAHILPDSVEATGEPTLAYTLFAGHSAALFAVLAGVGLALSSGGSTPHRGRKLTVDRVGLAVRAALIGIIALVIAAMTPEDPPANSILLYYAVFFLLAIPFLSLRPLALFLSAASLAVVSPLLMQGLYDVLPQSSAWNHTLVTLFTEPLGTASELLLTGTYPALTYMVFILTGLGLGRLDLRSTRVQASIAAIGAAVAVLAHLVSELLLYGSGGYEELLATSDMSMDTLDDQLVFGPEVLYNTSIWWQAIVAPHSGTALAIASSIGIAMTVLGVFLLLAFPLGRWLTPLAALGAMTLTIYCAHLTALIPATHYDEPGLWFILHVGVAAVFAWFWQRVFGRGPLERVVTRVVSGARTVAAGSVDDGNVAEAPAESGGASTEKPSASSSGG